MKKILKNIWTNANLLFLISLSFFILSIPSQSYAAPAVKLSPVVADTYSCGGPGSSVTISIDIGCSHEGNPILDATFAIIRILSDGVGLVIIASLIWAGIQYTTSRGDPQAVNSAVKRIQSNLTALLIFIFSYAMLNYIIPGQLLK
jgi:hypothetical protein